MPRTTIMLFRALTFCFLLPAFASHAADEEKPGPLPAAADASDNAADEGRSLLTRLTVTQVPVSADIDPGTGDDNPSSFQSGRSLRPVIFAPQPDGGAKIGWTDTDGRIHVTPIDERFVRSGPDMVFPSGLLRDLVAHDDGSAVLVMQNGGMYLIRIRNQEAVFQEKLISNRCRDIHMGSLAWNGEVYAAYFAIHRGGHEGDALRYVSADGEVLEGGWRWGCSHSIDMRVVTAEGRFMPLALSDAYPGTGFYFNHDAKRVAYTWGDRKGRTGGRIGGLVALKDRMFVAYSSRQGGRRHWSVALADFTRDAPHDQSVNRYLHDSESDQLNAKLARYGDDKLLVSWRDRDDRNRSFRLYDEDARPLGPAESLPVRCSPRADLKTIAAGDVAWAHVWGEETKALKVVLIEAR